MWTKINDDNVRHRWECPECNSHSYVKPWYYSEMGEPMCADCDRDMEYVRTEIQNDSLGCQMPYQDLQVHFVMRDCETKELAIARLKNLMPQYPDENTKYCESWVIIGSEEDE